MNLMRLLQGLKESTRVQSMKDFVAHSKHAITQLLVIMAALWGDIKVVERGETSRRVNIVSILHVQKLKLKSRK